MKETNDKKLIIIFTGPSGVGKGTIEKILFNQKDLRLQLSCSATTRKPREGEIDGQHYFFITKAQFEESIKNHELLEYSFHFDNYYGTLFREIDRIHASNNIPFLEIETEGAKQILLNPINHEKYKILTFFVSPPTIEDLKNRIKNRNTEDEAAILKRLQKAEQEITDKNHFKYEIINDIPERAAEEIRNILKNEIK
ncbi:guanylate kinase [Mycoplasmopsis gallinarum]|uniref:Guanylate kinase n=1 Tax=Mycoplasmopsis gallinarum TaxID=29557 RepID=A0A168RFV0_9BACT|nr:guanylate kinase [Mycoplasmopsis gallinarum]OAB48941.1 Guanylate kinase [Mycoplasmopsis gallinarum]